MATVCITMYSTHTKYDMLQNFNVKVRLVT